MADDRSVDMGDSSPTPPAADPSRPVVSVAGLTPTQQAYSDYVGHAVACEACRAVGASPCVKSEALWEAYRRLRREQAGARSDL